METIIIEKANALKAYNQGTKESSGKITDRIKTFEDACKELGIQPGDTMLNITSSLAKDKRSITAYCKLIIIARALNEGWKPDWTDSSENKYYPWFDMSSGSGLSYYDFDYTYTLTCVGARLCFKSKELAEYAAKQFVDIYKDYFVI